MSFRKSWPELKRFLEEIGDNSEQDWKVAEDAEVSNSVNPQDETCWVGPEHQKYHAPSSYPIMMDRPDSMDPAVHEDYYTHFMYRQNQLNYDHEHPRGTMSDLAKLHTSKLREILYEDLNETKLGKPTKAAKSKKKQDGDDQKDAMLAENFSAAKSEEAQSLRDKPWFYQSDCREGTIGIEFVPSTAI